MPSRCRKPTAPWASRHAALVAIATHRAGIEGNLADEALELLMEITNAGNKAAQDTLAEHIKTVDRDGWIRVQKKTFTRWANNHLKTRGMEIADLCEDVRSGVLLLNLLMLVAVMSV